MEIIQTPVTIECINNLWCIYMKEIPCNLISELPTAMHNNLSDSHEDTTEAEKQKHKGTFCMIPCIQCLKQAKLNGGI